MSADAWCLVIEVYGPFWIMAYAVGSTELSKRWKRRREIAKKGGGE